MKAKKKDRKRLRDVQGICDQMVLLSAPIWTEISSLQYAWIQETIYKESFDLAKQSTVNKLWTKEKHNHIVLLSS